jgi:hypothetical protein
MSQMAPEPTPGGGGVGNIFTGKIMGIPGIVWLIGAGALAYFLFFRNSGSSSGSPSTSGVGPGTSTITTGQTTIDTGAVQVSVTQNPTPSAAGNPQPKPPTTPKQAVFGGNRPASETSTIVAPGNEDLMKIAEAQGIPEQQLAALNPSWSHLVGTGKPVPKGTVLKVPKKGT